MSVSSIGSSSSAFSAIKDRFSAMQNGENLTKGELEGLQSKFEESEGTSSLALQKLSENFDELDANGDGLSLDEIPKGPPPGGKGGPPPGAEGMGQGPGSKSMDDLLAMRYESSESGQETDSIDQLIENFDIADADQDGSVSFAEAQLYADEHGLELPQGPQGGPQGGGRRGPPPGGKPPGSEEDEEDSSTSTLLSTALKSYSNANSYNSNSIDLMSLLGIDA